MKGEDRKVLNNLSKAREYQRVESDIIPEAERAAMAASQIRALVSVPLIKAGAWVGLFSVTDAAPVENVRN